MPLRFVATGTAASLVTLGVIALTSAPAGAVSADVVISAVYGGGGNSGATLTNDYIELHNLGPGPVDVGGWSVQYASAAGTSWQATALSGSILPGAFYLVAEAKGTGGTTALPTPDATGSIAMAAGAGKVALVTSATALACGATCSAAAGVKDFIGYGTANDVEGTAAPGLSNTTADARADGAADPDNNAADFTAGTPAPRSSGGGGTTTPPTDPGTPGLRIHDIQGAAHVSPHSGEQVAAVPGIVTAVNATGFWFQDPTPDASAATSEGLHVFTNAAPTVAVGDSVTVTGKVAEFRPGGAASANLATTEIDNPQVTLVASGQPLPAATLVGTGGRTPPPAKIGDDATGSVETSGTFNPSVDGLDFWESLEGMRVEIDGAAVVGPTNQFGETQIAPPGAGVRSARGGIVLQKTDSNPERIVLAGDIAAVPTGLNVGDSLVGPAVGIVDYNFSNFRFLATATPTVHSGGLAQEVTKTAAANQLAVATFNVENLDPTDPQAKFDRLAAIVVHNLAAPDIVALEEVQDNDGATDDGVVAADVTIAKFTAAIRAAGGPAYQFRSIDPVNDADGGEPGGNIRVGFLYRTDHGLSFVHRAGGTSTAANSVVVGAGGKPRLAFSPGRIDPTNTAWNASRKPLAAEFVWKGKTVFVIANHFNSKGGDQPLEGRFQPPTRSSETQRHRQATLVHNFVNDIVSADRLARVVVLGDLNDFDYSETADDLVAGNLLVDLPRTLPVPERYTYVFEGNSQVLDHILLSQALGRNTSPGFSALYEYDVVHVNAEFADQASDHDPQVVRLKM
jgi:predicted extracellular nuclease